MSWLEKINALKTVLSTIEPDSTWTRPVALIQTLQRVVGRIEHDLASLETGASFVFSQKWDLKSHTDQTVDLFRLWHDPDLGPSLTAISIYAIEKFGLEGQQYEAVVQGILMASLLGEVDNNLSYHNNMHYRNVLFLIIRMCVRHNQIYSNSERALSKEHIGSLIIAACIHDLGHDGKGNRVDGTHHPSLIEKRSFALAKPYLEGAGYDDARALDDLLVLLICTDVSPLNDRNSPVLRMKRVYLSHFDDNAENNGSIGIGEELSALLARPELSLMCLMLHEADIATSAGLSYNVTKYETRLLVDEWGAEAACPRHVIDFLENICQLRFLSGAGVQLFSDNLDVIYATAKQHLKEGDAPYKKPQDSDFLRNV